MPRQHAPVESDVAVPEAVESEAWEPEVAEAEIAEAEEPVIEVADDVAHVYSEDFRMVPQSSGPELAAAEDTQAEIPAPDAADCVTENSDQGARSLVRIVRDWLRRAA